jgi:hypothetical protein
MSLLTIIQAAAQQLSLPVPSSVVGNGADTQVHLLRLAQEEGRALAERHMWQALMQEHTFTTDAAEAQSTGLPSDIDRDRIVPSTLFNRTQRRRVVGPMSPEEWQHHKSQLITRVNPAYRIRGGTFYLLPIPPAGETIAYEYITKNWCASSTGTPQSAWAADTDTAVLDEKLITLGMVWRFKQAKGLDYQADAELYNRSVMDAILRDGTRPVITLDNMGYDRKPYAPQTPETLVF